MTVVQLMLKEVVQLHDYFRGPSLIEMSFRINTQLNKLHAVLVYCISFSSAALDK